MDDLTADAGAPVARSRRPGTPAGPSAPGRRPSTAPAHVHVLAKPTGPICNLACEYCFFLSKEALYPGDRFRMGDDLLEKYVRQVIEAQMGPHVTIAWQGGEPTLMGVGFFRRAVELVERYRRPEQSVEHTIQTNGTLLTDEWCDLFKENGFLVGISLDGPRELHDAHRVDKRGNPTFDKVVDGLRLLQHHDVDVNVLCTVNAANQDHGRDVYRFFRDELDIEYIQLLPVVEREDGTVFQEGAEVTDRSVEPEAWGRFLIEVFDEWVRRDVGRVFVSQFDAALASWMGVPPAVCLFQPTCGDAVALEHNGDLYSCDHFVEPAHLIGNIGDTHLADLVDSPQQRAFGAAKLHTLPRCCRDCASRFACHGECPKNRFTFTPDGEPGLNYLCAGYLAFFAHIDTLIRLMADLLRQGRHADEIMGVLSSAARNEPCPCGSRRKAKHCHRD